MKLHVVATGSRGNAYVLDFGGARLLLDCGIPWREAQKALGFDLRGVEAVFVTHEHMDHAKGVRGAVDAGLRVVMSDGTRAALNLRECDVQVRRHYERFRIGGFTCVQFPAIHDAAEPCGWLIRCDATGETLLYATDTQYIEVNPAGVHYWLVECNFQREIMEGNIAVGKLHEGMRIRLLRSHMELETLAAYFDRVSLAKSRQIVLLHLSDGNSNEDTITRRIGKKSGVPTVCARAGMMLDMRLCPF